MSRRCAMDPAFSASCCTLRARQRPARTNDTERQPSRRSARRWARTWAARNHLSTLFADGDYEPVEASPRIMCPWRRRSKFPGVTYLGGAMGTRCLPCRTKSAGRERSTNEAACESAVTIMVKTAIRKSRRRLQWRMAKRQGVASALEDLRWANNEKAMAQRTKSKHAPTRSRKWLEAECLKLARQAPGGSEIACVTIRRLRPNGARTNWKVADLIPQPSLLVSRKVRGALAPLTGAYALEDES